MRKSFLQVSALAIILLFTIQAIGTLVESIYILDLMKSGLDEKALGVLFFFGPLLVVPFFKNRPRILVWILTVVLIVSRGLTPYLTTASRIPASGIAVIASISLFFLLITTMTNVGSRAAPGLALAVGLSALLRTVGHGIEYSLTPAGGWVGVLLGLLLAACLYSGRIEVNPAGQPKGGKRTLAVIGIYLVITLVYFSFSAPAVIARWTEGNYTLIVAAVSFLSLFSTWLFMLQPGLLDRLSTRLLVAWNLLFTISLTLTLVAQRVPFPPTLDSPPVVVGAPGLLPMILLGITLLLFPVLFCDFQVFVQGMHASPRSPGSLLPGIALGGLFVILLVFINIFSNVWGYIRPVSPPFRNTFWLVFFLISAILSLLTWRMARSMDAPEAAPVPVGHWSFTSLLAVIFVVTLVFALPVRHVPVEAVGKTSIRAMTFNTQQSNDDFAEKSFEAQLALIREVSPDILSMQETDSTRISLNNNDYVRYFADHLGYYSYFGPKTVSGSFGTAILSKYPLENPRTVYIYSDKDETAVAEAEVEVGGLRFTIFDVHPDSSDPAMVVFAQTLVFRAHDKPYVIALGDFNLRDYEPAYQIIDESLTNAWTSVYPTEISPSGIDMSGDNRIDHIFLSRNLTAVNPMYILPPESATDHPVHWTDITWANP